MQNRHTRVILAAVQRFAGWIVLFVSVSAAADPTLDLSQDPHPGIHRERWIDSAVPARIHLARVDLATSTISVIATTEQDKAITPATFASRVGAQLAINGDFFAAATFVPRGLAVGDKMTWFQTADNELSGVIHFDRSFDDRAVITITPPETHVAPEALPPQNQGVVSGRPLLVRAGIVQAPVCDDPVTLACTRAPRTALGVTADGNTLLLAVVDGWQPGSVGLTANELAAFLVQRGARDAIGLDVGASSAMVLDGATISSPSDGVLRPVANHVAVKYGFQDPGQLVGVICLRDIFDCTTKISMATVTLDDGQTDLTDATGIYDFPMVPPRYACVDVTADGYEPASKCTQVESNTENYNSVALFPIGERPDARPPSDAGNPGGVDADTNQPPPGGCCDAGGSDPAPAIVLAIIVVALTRRRRTPC
jgi:hypothetical protein